MSSTVIKTGNTLLPPPRLTGVADQDTPTIQRYLADLYDQLAKAQNVIGSVKDAIARIGALEADVASFRSLPSSASGLTSGQFWQDPAANHVVKYVP